jgi:hypothetical protein
MLNRLPPHTFAQRVNGDAVHYVYADPLVCGCLYDPAWSWNAWGPGVPHGFVYGPGVGW